MSQCHKIGIYSPLGRPTPITRDDSDRVEVCGVCEVWSVMLLCGCWFQQAYGEDINSQNSRFIIDFLKSRVPAKKKVCQLLCVFVCLLCLFMGDLTTA